MPSADWYFDFVSPFAYLQSEQLGLARPRVAVRYRPVLFAGLLEATARRGRRRFRRSARSRIASSSGRRKSSASPLKFPPEHPFNPLPLLRLALACDCDPQAVQRIFRFVWRDGRLPDLPIEWAELTERARHPDGETRIASAEIKDALRRNTDEAIARGVFGVPTLAIGDELFWGADATAMAADYVAAGCRFDDPEYARVARCRSAPRAAPSRKRRVRSPVLSEAKPGRSCHGRPPGFAALNTGSSRFVGARNAEVALDGARAWRAPRRASARGRSRGPSCARAARSALP